jgi:hypothetical protein
MSYFSLLSHNRIAQFAARFETQADGTIVYYHSDRQTGGVRCTEAERDQLIAEFARTNTRSFQWMVYWAIISGIIIGLLEASETLILQRWVQYAVILAPFPVAVYAWYQASARPLQLLNGRLPYSQPRSRENAMLIRVAVLPPSLFVMMSLCSGGLLYYGFRDGWHTLTISSWLIIASNVLMIVVWLYAVTRKDIDYQ